MANDSRQTIMQGQSPLDLAVQNIVTANREQRPGVEVAAGLLYAAILENTNIPSKDLPRYAQLTHIANAAGFIENAIPTVTGLVNSVVNIPKKVSATVSALPQALQDGANNLKNKQFVADIVVGITSHINRANHPVKTTLAAVEYAYHAIKNDGGNMNMEERKALAVLYRQPKAARLEALRTGEWEKFISTAAITVGPKIAMDAPTALQNASNALKASVAGLAPQTEMATAGVGTISMGADTAEGRGAQATVMQSKQLKSSTGTLSVETEANITPITRGAGLSSLDGALIKGAEADQIRADYALLRHFKERLTAEHEATQFAYEHKSEILARASRNYENILTSGGDANLAMQNYTIQRDKIESITNWELTLQERAIKLLSLNEDMQSLLVEKTLPGSATLARLEQEENEMYVASKIRIEAIEGEKGPFKDYRTREAYLKEDSAYMALSSKLEINSDEQHAAQLLINSGLDALNVAPVKINAEDVDRILQSLTKTSHYYIAIRVSDLDKEIEAVNMQMDFDMQALDSARRSFQNHLTDNIVSTTVRDRSTMIIEDNLIGR